MTPRLTARSDRCDVHPYAEDVDTPADHRGNRPCRCGLPGGNAVHLVPDTAEEQAEQRRRAGERE